MADGHPHIGSYRGIRETSQAAQKSELLNRLRTDFPNSRLNAIEIRGARAFCFYEVFCSANVIRKLLTSLNKFFWSTAFRLFTSPFPLGRCGLPIVK